MLISGPDGTNGRSGPHSRSDLLKVPSRTDHQTPTLPGLDPLDGLRKYLRRSENVARFPQQKALARTAASHCITAIKRAEEKCCCQKGPPSRGNWTACAYCQHAEKALETYTELERLRIEWVKVEERLLRTMITAAGPKGTGKVVNNGVVISPQDTSRIIREYRENRGETVPVPREQISDSSTR